MKERKITQGGFEEIYPKLFQHLRSHASNEGFALAAGLSKNQWLCIKHYLENPDFKYIQTQTNISRPNIYLCLYPGFARLEMERRRSGNEE